jgi:hypothetical protein
MDQPVSGRSDLLHVISDFMEVFPMDRWIDDVVPKEPFFRDEALEIMLVNFAEFMSNYETITMLESVAYDHIEEKVICFYTPGIRGFLGSRKGSRRSKGEVKRK